MRLRANNQFGLLGATLAPGGGTITFTSAPGFPTIVAPDYYPITLEPNTANEEIVYLTAFTAGQTTGTIQRAQEGTAAATHNSGTSWAHVPTAQDFQYARLLGYFETTVDYSAALSAGQWSTVPGSHVTVTVGSLPIIVEAEGWVNTSSNSTATTLGIMDVTNSNTINPYVQSPNPGSPAGASARLRVSRQWSGIPSGTLKTFALVIGAPSVAATIKLLASDANAGGAFLRVREAGAGA